MMSLGQSPILSISSELNQSQKELLRILPELKELLKRWEKRNGDKFTMALTKDVKAGIVNSKNYPIIQQRFSDIVTDYEKEEIIRTINFFKDSGQAISYEDFGVGQCWMIHIAKIVIEAGMQYRLWEFTKRGFKNGIPFLENLFTNEDGVLTYPNYEKLICFGALQLLFGDDPKYHQIKKYCKAFFCRILQDNADDYEKIVSNIPLQAAKGGRVTIVTIFSELNQDIEYTHSTPKEEKLFLPTLNSKLKEGEKWDVLRRLDFRVYPPGISDKSEWYSIITVGNPNIIGHQY